MSPKDSSPSPSGDSSPGGADRSSVGLPLMPHTLASSHARSHDHGFTVTSSQGLAERERQVRTLLRVASRIAGTLDRDVIVNLVLESAIELVGGDTGSVMLLDPYEQSLWIAASVGLAQDVVRSTVVGLGEGIAGWVAQTGKGMVINDSADERKTHRSVRSAVSVPMRVEDGRLYGVMNVGTKSGGRTYTDRDVEVLEPVAELAALALRNADELEESRRLFLDTLRALVVAMETKDPYARGHTEHVTRYAVLLAREVGLDEAEVRRIELAALLHDIGRMASGEALLVSGRPLTAVEQTLIKMHPTVAAHVLKDAPDLADVVPIIFHHHERYDGTGYLGGLKGGDIPLGARILAVADAFEAITSDRPHRKARSTKDAIRELKRGAGTQFDPELVEAFVALVERDPDIVG